MDARQAPDLRDKNSETQKEDWLQDKKEWLNRIFEHLEIAFPKGFTSGIFLIIWTDNSAPKTQISILQTKKNRNNTDQC